VVVRGGAYILLIKNVRGGAQKECTQRNTTIPHSPLRSTYYSPSTTKKPLQQKTVIHTCSLFSTFTTPPYTKTGALSVA